MGDGVKPNPAALLYMEESERASLSRAARAARCPVRYALSSLFFFFFFFVSLLSQSYLCDDEQASGGCVSGLELGWTAGRRRCWTKPRKQ